MIRKTIKKILQRKKYVEVSGSVIPSRYSRCCGSEFKDDNFYLESAENEANRLIDNFHCTKQSRILDVGCGQGRLPIGILRVIGDINYIGIDVDLKSINWCKQYIELKYPTFKFKHLNIYNERYNNNGIKIDEEFCFDGGSRVYCS